MLGDPTPPSHSLTTRHWPWQTAAACLLGFAYTGLIYLTFTNQFSLDEFCGRYRPTWVFPILERPTYTAMRGEIFLAILAVATATYLAAVRLARGIRAPAATVLLLALVPIAFVLALAPSYPLTSNDIFKYVFDGRIMTVYGQNPFLHVPAEFPDDRFYELVYWKAEVNAHGPLWRVAEAAAAQAGGNSCEQSIMSMKLWPSFGYLGTVLALFLVLRRTQPSRAVTGAMTYAWNPLVVLESLQNGHNDVIAALPMVLAVCLAMAHHVRWSLPLVIVSALIKPLGLLVAPIIVLAALRRGRAGFIDASIGLIVGALLLVAAFAPFWAGAETLQGIARSELFTDSPAAALLVGLQRIGMELDGAMIVASATSQVLFGLGMALVLAALWRGQLSVLNAAIAGFVLFGLVGAQWFNPWYLLWLAPLAALSPDAPPRVLGMTFTLLAPLIYIFRSETLLSVLIIFGTMAVLAFRERHWLGWPAKSLQSDMANASARS